MFAVHLGNRRLKLWEVGLPAGSASAMEDRK